jgi:PHD/YefM family antitoxin component YafN of YafNO toxin-antitoxin module
MKTFTITQAQTQFDEFFNTAQHEPVQVVKDDQVVAVMVPAKDYEAMRIFYTNRLQQRLKQSAATAEAAGFNPASF